MPHPKYAPGDWVVYRKSKMGPHPGPRAAQVHASPKGENYSYIVNKFWVVDRVQGGELVLRTRRGKIHVVSADDPNLRRASWLDRLLWRGRFLEIQSGGEPSLA